MYIWKKKNWLAGVFIVTEVGVFWHGRDPACFICLFSYLIPALNSPRAAQGQQQQGQGQAGQEEGCGSMLWAVSYAQVLCTPLLHPPFSQM